MKLNQPQLDEYQKLALFCRALWRQGFNDLLPGRISLRQDRGTFLLSPADRRWDQMRASDVVLQSADGIPLVGPASAGSGSMLHRWLHANRPDAVWVGLLRSRAVAYWSSTERVPLAYDELGALSGSMEPLPPAALETEGRLEESLGSLAVPTPIILVSGSGALVTAENVEQFATRAVALEARCRTATSLAGVADARELKPDRERALFGQSLVESFGLWPALVADELQDGSEFLD